MIGETKTTKQVGLEGLVGAVVGGTMVLFSTDDSNEEKIGGWIATCSAFLSKDIVAGFRLVRMKIKRKFISK